ncbi:hypothetical protein ACP275_04G164600 [Erythranthe tilingii]
MDTISYSLVFLILVVAFTTEASYHDKDDVVWQKRAEEAKIAARRAYHPNPLSVSNNLNHHVHKSTEGSNSTRRGLARRGGSKCQATNPIDQCWRCQRNWERNRRKLVDCALGFGRHVTGGKAGRTYVVTNSADDDLVNPKKGTLRYGVIQKEPLWIIFARSMVIRLSQELIMTSNKTIDGRGAQIHIANGAGLTIQYVSNVVIHNIRIHDIKAGNGGLIRDSVNHYGYRSRSDGDAISMFGATNVWIDHVSLSKCVDGLIDAIEGSTAITISNSHFTHHNDVMLFGASDSYSGDQVMQITVAFNHFGKGLIQRMPRVRWGFVHIVNNDYTRWEMYAIGGSQHPTILSQGNNFVAPQDRFAKEVTKRDYAPESVWKNWVWKSEGDVMKNGAFFKQSGDPKHKFALGYGTIAPKPGGYVASLTKFAGPLKCIKGRPC